MLLKKLPVVAIIQVKSTSKGIVRGLLTMNKKDNIVFWTSAHNRNHQKIETERSLTMSNSEFQLAGLTHQ